MVMSCCVVNCVTRSKKGNGISFHFLPKNNNELKERWISAIGRKGLHCSSTMAVCSKHFVESDFIRNFGSIRLKPNAVPTVFHISPHILYKKKSIEIGTISEEPSSASDNECTENTNEVPDVMGPGKSSVQKELSIDNLTEKLKNAISKPTLGTSLNNNILHEVTQNGNGHIGKKQLLQDDQSLIATDANVDVSAQLPQHSVENPPELSRAPQLNNSCVPIIGIHKNNFQEICRCCLINKGEINVFEAHFKGVPFSELIHHCTHEKIQSSDDLPRSICNKCMQLIMTSYTFIKSVKENQIHLHELSDMFKNQSCNINPCDTKNSHRIDDDVDVSSIANINEKTKNASNTNEGIDNCLTSFEVPKDFKKEFKGIGKIYNELRQVLRENRRAIKGKRDNIEKKNDVKVVPDRKENEPIVSKECKLNNSTENITGECFTLSNVNRNDTASPNNVNLESSTMHSETVRTGIDINVVQGGTDESNQQIESSSNLGTMQDNNENVSVTEKNNKIIHPIDSGISSVCFKETLCGKVCVSEVSTLSSDQMQENLEKLIYSDFFGKGSSKFDSSANIQPDQNVRYIQCFECAMVFQTEKRIIEHCKETGHVFLDRFKCEICSLTFQYRKKYKTHLKTHKKAYSVCEICGHTIMATNLNRHLSTHNNDVLNVCHLCGKTFSQRTTLDEHVKKVHSTGVNGCLCSFCGKVLASIGNLNKHLNHRHRMDTDLHKKCYFCQQCKKYFATQVSLNLHKSFSHGENQRRYNTKRKRQQTTNEQSVNKKHKQSFKKFDKTVKQCSICSKYIKISAFKYHMYIHQGIKPYSCKVCYKKFRQRVHLNSHMNLHLNVKPYECKYCGKRFRHSTSLHIHVRSHTGETPYICMVCKKGFYHLTSMKVHLKTHLNKESTDSDNTTSQ